MSKRGAVTAVYIKSILAKRGCLCTTLATPRLYQRSTPCLFSRLLSSQPFSDADPTKTSSSAILRKVAKPFLLRCHPDVQMNDAARSINLAAVQTLNGFMDAVETLCRGKRAELKPRYEIEFIISSSSSSGSSVDSEEVVRRAVELRLEPVLRSNILSSTTASERQQAVASLEQSARREIVKVLRVAGLPVPDADELESEHSQDAINRERTVRRFNNLQRPSRRRKPMNRFDEQRDKFVKSIDWKRHRQLLDEAIQDAYADIATDGLVDKNPRRRQEFVSRLLSKVRVLDEEHRGLGPVQQLIAIRRLFALLHENFEKLYMEDFGRMWETSTIILTPPRPRKGRSSEESGFKFLYGANDILTIHIPIDFGDYELVQHLEQNVLIFFNIFNEEIEAVFPERLKSTTVYE